MKTYEGSHDASGLRFAIVVSRFNEFVTGRLLAGACDALAKAGARDDAIEVVHVPGAFEIPLVARRVAQSGRCDAVICIGAVIRGETPHFEYISAEASRGIAQAAWDSDVPVVFGVLTTDNVDQAMERSGAPERNRGAEAARTAVEMATVLRKLAVTPSTRKSKKGAKGPHRSRSKRMGGRRSRTR